MLCVKIIVNGLVQGVGFRYSTLRKARQLNIKGFVKNRLDGSVYIEASCNDKERLTLFITWCYEGPAHASVSDVVYEKIPAKNFSTFEIR